MQMKATIPCWSFTRRVGIMQNEVEMLIPWVFFLLNRIMDLLLRYCIFQCLLGLLLNSWLIKLNQVMKLLLQRVDKISLLEMPEHKKKKMTSLTTNIMRDDNDKVLALGQPGEEVSLQLILRVVADVGLVGLPNAEKSTLLAATTLAEPDIADYPLTTLMLNLGHLNGDSSLGAGQFSSEATLADLPGLIEGAHLGKGLGRNFLRHLRRTRLLVHVVDAAGEDPVHDYRTVKEELLMYNPEYLERPYIVVLNKIDITEAMERLPSLTEEIWQIGSDTIELQSDGPSTSDSDQIDTVSHEKVKEIEEYPRPLAVVGVSVLKGMHIAEMLKEIRAALCSC